MKASFDAVGLLVCLVTVREGNRGVPDESEDEDDDGRGGGFPSGGD